MGIIKSDEHAYYENKMMTDELDSIFQVNVVSKLNKSTERGKLYYVPCQYYSVSYMISEFRNDFQDIKYKS